MKKLLCLLICLLLPLTALAAPTRDMRETALSDAELETMRAWLDQTVREALPVEYDETVYVGASVYSCVEDAGCYVLECDVYLEEGADTLPEFAPDEVLTWLCDATVAVRRVSSGYELVSCEIGEYYLMDHMDVMEGAGYSVCLPDFFAPNDRDVYDYSCYADGEQTDAAFIAGVRYRAEDAADKSLTEYACALAGESDSLLVDENGEIGMVTVQDSGLYIVVYAGDGAYHSLTLVYPEDREAEFTLYGEFMRNSFVVEGEANG